MGPSLSVFPLSNHRTARHTKAKACLSKGDSSWSNKWILGSVPSVHQASAKCSVCFCFHSPKDLVFSPRGCLCFMVLCTECSPYLLLLREERERLCYPSLFGFIAVVLEFGPQKAGAGLLFRLSHMGSMSSLA